ncbi:MAG: ABC transporter permease [Candidatus Moranbacteria bacterium]|nr:ABC transporter permease [Candidatus Moranbacteria bacterium]
MFRDLFKETIWSLAGNKVRSGLTMLGIIIGIASVIALVAIGQGAQNSIEANIQAIGSNLIVISPGAQKSGSGLSSGRGSAQTLTFEDANAIAVGITDLKGVAPEVSRRYQVTAKSNNTNTQIIGTVPAYPAVRNINIDSGTFVTEQQVKTSAKVAVLGSAARDDLFGAEADPVGKTIRIQNIDFEIIGVMLSKGGSGFSNPDDSIYIPLTSAQHFLSGDDYVSSISVAASDQNSIASAQQQITDLLLARHKITDPTQADFSTINQSDIVATASSITGTFTVLLSSIAGISLLVGGIGIMNMMLTTVTERTREIGLRKAVGIRKIYINMQFLAEAIVLTFLGGAIGILLGWVASLIISNIISLEAEVSMSSILLAFGVSAAVGIIFGFYPARKAAAMSPIDALRYE